jgi:alpha-aminoadipic semialdehyde synthase
LPVKNISPNDIKKIFNNSQKNCLYKVVFKENDIVEPISDNYNFDLQDYYQNPNKYKSIFEKYTPYLTILMNCIYWDKRYPRLITKDFIKENFLENWNLEIVGDISIDINGAIEFSEKATSQDNPVYIYNPINNSIKDGFDGEGVVIMGIDNLPCELPIESSTSFSNVLYNYVNSIAKADFSGDFEKCDLPDEIKKAVILYQGKLTSNYQYIDKYL